MSDLVVCSGPILINRMRYVADYYHSITDYQKGAYVMTQALLTTGKHSGGSMGGCREMAFNPPRRVPVSFLKTNISSRQIADNPKSTLGGRTTTLH